MDERVGAVIAKIEHIIEALNECGRGDHIQFDEDEIEMLICISREAIKAVREQKEGNKEGGGQFTQDESI